MYVYAIINEVNLKMYIGKTDYPASREWQHFNSAKKDSTQVIHRAIRKYGREAFHFHVLQSYASSEEALQAEKYWISVYDTTLDGWGYNMTLGGETNVPSEALKAHLSVKLKEYFGTPGARERQSEAIRKYFETPGAKERQSALISAYANSHEGQITYSERMLKFFEDPAARQRWSEMHTARFALQSERDKVSVGLKKHFECPMARKRNKDRQIEAWKSPTAVENQRQAQFKRHNTPEMLSDKAKIIQLYSEGLGLSAIMKIVPRNWRTVRRTLINAGLYVSVKKVNTSE